MTIQAITRFTSTNAIRLTLSLADGTTTEKDVHYMDATGLPVVQNEHYADINTFLTAGGTISVDNDPTPPVPNMKPIHAPLNIPAPTLQPLAPNTKVQPPKSSSIISDRQFFQQLAVMGKITSDEALAYVSTGAIPTSMMTLINQLPPQEQFPAKMLIIGETTFDRYNPLVMELGQMYGMTPDDIDALWAAAARL